MKQPKRNARRGSRRAATCGQLARQNGHTLTTHDVGALPLLNRILQRMKLEEFLQEYLPPEDGRTKVPTARVLLVLVRNLLVSREPLYGVGEWAARQAPDLLGLSPQQVARLNDDRCGRAVDKLFACDQPSLVLALVAHTVRVFAVALDELHNDGTSVSVYGAYQGAARQRRERGRVTPAVTFGHSKNHRPDLKQLIYLLTVTADGAVPVHFSVGSGNLTDDQTHRDTWDLLRELVGQPDFLYVADSKLATVENMGHIARRGGRFLSILPRTRSEDGQFRQRVRQGEVTWKALHEKHDDEGKLVDRYSVCPEAQQTADGYRLVWYHSTRKAELDQLARSRRLERALRGLHDLQGRLSSPRTRFRDRGKVAEAVEKILGDCQVELWILPQIEEEEEKTFRQARRGRPSADTPFRREVRRRFSLAWHIDYARMAEEQLTDGIFPLVTNDRALSELELLLAYKRQPQIEKRFAQLKTDYEVAPVYLKEVRRIQALLCVYFLAQLVQALLERELRRAMEREELDSLPLYPEGRPCRCPTTRKLIDLFEPVQRHTLTVRGQESTTFVTELAPLQRRILKLLGIPANTYGQ
jgi:transposase